MKHGSNFFGEHPSNLDVFAVAADHLGAFFSAQMPHGRHTAHDFAGGCNFESFVDDFSGFVFYFIHIDPSTPAGILGTSSLRMTPLDGVIFWV